MIIQIDIPDDAIKQENIKDIDVFNAIKYGVYHTFSIRCNYNIIYSKIKFFVL